MPSTAASLCADDGERGNTVKKQTGLILLLAAFLLLCACVPTPEEPVVIGKDQSAMVEKAQEKPAYAQTEGTFDWLERLGAPARYTATLTSIGGRLKVEADAKVIVPDGELPIVFVTPRSFSDEDAERFMKALLGDDPKCLRPEDENRTKAMYERQILEWSYALDHWEEYGASVWDMYDTKEEFREALQGLMEKAADAPETLETFAPVLAWEPILWQTDAGQRAYGDESMHFLTLNADGTKSSLSITNGADVARSGVHYWRDSEGLADQLEDVDGGQWQNELQISEEEARAAAEATLSQMGLGHLVCAFGKFIRCYRMNTVREDAPYQSGWMLVYTPAVNGTALTYTLRTGVDNNDYNRRWQYERCYLLVDEKGVALLHYYDACTLDSVMVKACTLLPFEKIVEIFEKMVLIVDNDADLYDVDRTYRITSVRLGMTSIPAENGNGGFLVPCWDFMGDEYAAEEFPETWKRTGMTQDGSFSYLTINAIDGSIIQRGH